jgi:hypothetical protein
MTMDTLTVDILRSLAEWKQGPCVSIHLPLDRNPAASKKDAVVLRHLLDEALQRLVETGMRSPTAKELLVPARQLFDQRRRSDFGSATSLALYVAPALYRWFKLSVVSAPFAFVGNSFHVIPLAHQLTYETHFAVLALSSNAIRLFRTERSQLVPVDLPEEMPSNLEEALAGTEIEKSLQFHTTSAVDPRGRFSGTAHGHGMPKEYEKTLLTDYFRRVSGHLETALNQLALPCVVAAVGYLHPLFRETCRSEFLLDAKIEASPDELTEAELLERARPIFSEHTRKRLCEPKEQYRDLLGTDRVTEDLSNILAAAEEGRIDLLFARAGDETWGTWNQGNHRAEVHDEYQRDDVDLRDLAVRRTLTTGGTPLVVDGDDMPVDEPLASILRW